jgi:toxin-antitoxin system PIN domain toxin
LIALDTNILVYAHREDCPFHAAALASVTGLAEGRSAWAIPWPCIHEFLAIATHPRIWRPPSTATQAVNQVDAWLESPSLHLLGETAEHWPKLRAAVVRGRVAGALVHDARIAALCLQHGVRELWTVDRDFSRFIGLAVRNPLLQ